MPRSMSADGRSDGQPSAPSDDQLDRWTHVRNKFGYGGDRERTRQLHNERGLRSGLRIPMSPQEESDWAEREALRENRERMLAKLARHQPDNGGMYTDQKAGGRVVL